MTLINKRIKILFILWLLSGCNYLNNSTPASTSIESSPDNLELIEAIMREVAKDHPDEDQLISHIAKSNNINYWDQNNVPLLFSIVEKNLSRTLQFIIEHKKGDIYLVDGLGMNVFLRMAYMPVNLEILKLLLPLIDPKSLSNILNFLLDSLCQINLETDSGIKANKSTYYDYYFTSILNRDDLDLFFKENNLSLLDKAIVYGLAHKDKILNKIKTLAKIDLKDSQLIIYIYLKKLSFFSDESMLDYLISKGGDINCRDSNGKTILHYASERANKELLEILLRKQAKAHIKDKQGLLPICYANNLEIISPLLEKGDYSPDILNITLINAIRGKDRETVKLLISKGVDPSYKVDERELPLIEAVRAGDQEILDILLDIIPVDSTIKDSKGKNLLQIAAESGHFHILPALLEAGGAFFINDEDDNKEDVLFKAAFNGHIEIAHLLLRKGANRLSLNKAMKALLQRGTIENIDKFIIAFPTTKEDFYKEGKKLSLLAVEENNIELVKSLFSNHAFDVHEKDHYGKEPLHYVKSIPVLNLLIDMKADPNHKDHKGKTPLYYVNHDLIEPLIKKGANPNVQDLEGNTPLIVAAYGRNMYEITELVKNGANPQIRNLQGIDVDRVISLGHPDVYKDWTNQEMKDVIDLYYNK